MSTSGRLEWHTHMHLLSIELWHSADVWMFRLTAAHTSTPLPSCLSFSIQARPSPCPRVANGFHAGDKIEQGHFVTDEYIAGTYGVHHPSPFVLYHPVLSCSGLL
jgi:hypothetical protein